MAREDPARLLALGAHVDDQDTVERSDVEVARVRGRSVTTDTHPDVAELHVVETGGGEPSMALNAWRSVPQPASKDLALIPSSSVEIPA